MTLWNDLRFAARQLRKSPSFAFTMVLTFGLCMERTREFSAWWMRFSFGPLLFRILIA
jgi:hypothetical protein